MTSLYIVYEEASPTEDGRFLKFEGKDADRVGEALFNAEKIEALGAHVRLLEKEYWFRTGKYLYWFTED